jgi:signal transduction histidine kinase
MPDRFERVGVVWPLLALATAAFSLAGPRVPDEVGAALGGVIAIVAFGCGAFASNGRGLAGVLVLSAALQVRTGLDEFPNLEIYVGTLAPWWIGGQVRRRRALIAELSRRSAELEAEQDAFARLSVLRERARIARELHDIVAHHLAVIVVQAGAGRMAGADPPEAAAVRFASIRESGDQALGEMARLVDLLERSSTAGLSGLRGLVAEARASGLDVDVAWLPADVDLPTTTEEAAFGAVREGLTNAIKHAPGAFVCVRLALDDGGLDIEVRDDGGGDGSALADSGSGLGLVGMRERVEALGGSLEAGPVAGGWRLVVRLPVRALARR